MNAVQQAEVIAIIEQDCQIGGCYVMPGSPEGRQITCAIGALALAAGVPTERFGANLTWCNNLRISHPELSDVVSTIRNRFGLSLIDLIEIQSRNDSADNVPARREKILRFVNSIHLE